MSQEILIENAKKLWEREWSASMNNRKGKHVPTVLQTCPSPSLIETLVDMVAEDPSRPVAELESIIHRMLFENQFIDDGGDSVILDSFDSIDVQTTLLVKVLEQVRQQGLEEGLWSTAPTTPMMFG